MEQTLTLAMVAQRYRVHVVNDHPIVPDGRRRRLLGVTPHGRQGTQRDLTALGRTYAVSRNLVLAEASSLSSSLSSDLWQCPSS
jgi:hypothetical protein